MKVFVAVASVFPAICQAGTIQRRDDNGVSTCGSTWMAVNNVKTNHDTVERTGYNAAVDRFCDAADRQEVGASLYLSMATRVWLDYGGDPTYTGLNGYVYFEIHNKQKDKHVVDGAKCKDYLKSMSKDSSKCYGGLPHDDTKGGTYQVGNDAVSYHALGNDIPPIYEHVDKTVVLDHEISPLGSNLKGNTLDPFPVESFGDSVPVGCHSHNDYERGKALYYALSAGCVGVEADIWAINNDLVLKHKREDGNGNTLQDLYLNPLQALLENNNAIFPRNKTQPLNLLIDFKTDVDPAWDMLVKQLQPLRDAGYLSTSSNGQFKQGLITVVASGNAIISSSDGKPKLYAGNNPSGAIFADAQVAKDMANFNSGNAYYASSEDNKKGSDEKAKADRDEAHRRGLKVRYWGNTQSTADWQKAVDIGVDRVNVDKLQDVAAIAWRQELL